MISFKHECIMVWSDTSSRCLVQHRMYRKDHKRWVYAGSQFHSIIRLMSEVLVRCELDNYDPAPQRRVIGQLITYITEHDPSAGPHVWEIRIHGRHCELRGSGEPSYPTEMTSLLMGKNTRSRATRIRTTANKTLHQLCTYVEWIRPASDG